MNYPMMINWLLCQKLFTENQIINNMKNLENFLNKYITKYLGWFLYPASKQGKEKQNEKWNNPR